MTVIAETLVAFRGTLLKIMLSQKPLLKGISILSEQIPNVRFFPSGAPRLDPRYKKDLNPTIVRQKELEEDLEAGTHHPERRY